ncbi:glycosyltransferase family 2 protein [Nitrosopumilus sp. K4]|nr:glycosyltransferase family 2 protein [Nitrosopumilus sp. K4]
MNFFERVYSSTYFKWIIIFDGVWLAIALLFAQKRKYYRTDPNKDYLSYYPLESKQICVIIVAYNEELAIGKVIDDFVLQKNVKEVIVIDNHSEDNTVKIAQEHGAKVITKEKNMGFGHSCVVGFQEALKTDYDIIVLVEGDGSSNGYDLEKMIPYLDNSDLVLGTRLIQTLSEKGNQVKMMYVWGNYFLAKLIQIKFFSLLHMGSVSLTDVGCILRVIRKESLKEIIQSFTDHRTGKVIPGNEFSLYMIIESIKANLRVVEVPVTSNKRIGESKIGSDKKFKAIKMGLSHIWFILKS